MPVSRPLPQLDDYNEFFWKSGADGLLRFRRCTACGRLDHPPSSVCRGCLGTEFEVVPVSGRAVVAGFTVNHHPWVPSFPPPYVVAIVAMEEDDRLRLTTNIVECDPDDVFIGMKVEVRFEQAGDVWVPVFRPTGDTTPGPIPVEADVNRNLRPMASRDKFEHKVALTGIGMSRVGRRLMEHPVTLAVEACRAAVADAGLDLQDIDGLATYPSSLPARGMSEGGITPIEDVLQIHPTWHNGTPETPGQVGAVISAMLAVAAGLCRHVLCYRTVWEATATAQTRARTPDAASSVIAGMGASGGARIAGDWQWRIPFGAPSAANWIGMNAMQHFHRYGTTRETLGWIALTARANAARNPLAIYREPLTMDDYLSARMITTPFGLYDCDVPCDGAVAVIVSRKDEAADLRQPPVLVEAVGTAITERISWDQGTLQHEPMVTGPATHMWTRTDLRQGDIDFVELYDGFTFNCVSWLEALGFCGTGEAKDFLAGGTRIALGGELPLNTHGGQLSAGRLHGYGFLHEAVVQLRGQGGERQVANAEVGVVSSGGGVPGGALLLTAAR